MRRCRRLRPPCEMQNGEAHAMRSILPLVIHINTRTGLLGHPRNGSGQGLLQLGTTIELQRRNVWPYNQCGMTLILRFVETRTVTLFRLRHTTPPTEPRHICKTVRGPLIWLALHPSPSRGIPVGRFLRSMREQYTALKIALHRNGR